MVVLALVLGGPVVGAAALPSCTTFDGLTVGADANTNSNADGNADADADGSDATLDAPLSETSSAPEAGPEAGPDAATRMGYLSLDDAARACSLIFKCPELAPSVLVSVAVPVDPINYSLCVHWLAAPVPPDRPGLAVQAQAFACMAKKGASCNAASACLAEELVAGNDTRCAGVGIDGGEVCGDDGGTVLNCAGGYFLHCGAAYYGPGSQCLVGLDGAHFCALGTNCTVQASCIGTIFDYCGAGDNLHESINCAYDGYTCDVATNQDAGLPNCNTGTQYLSCSTAGTSCAGAVVDVCDGAQVSEFNCAALGQSCLAQAGPAICGTSSDACTPFDPSVNLCNGSSLSLCVGGHPQQVDCSAIGLACIPGAGAQSGHCG